MKTQIEKNEQNMLGKKYKEVSHILIQNSIILYTMQQNIYIQ